MIYRRSSSLSKSSAFIHLPVVFSSISLSISCRFFFAILHHPCSTVTLNPHSNRKFQFDSQFHIRSLHTNILGPFVSKCVYIDSKIEWTGWELWCDVCSIDFHSISSVIIIWFEGVFKYLILKTQLCFPWVLYRWWKQEAKRQWEESLNVKIEIRAYFRGSKNSF